jgi:hypothetical protein
LLRQPRGGRPEEYMVLQQDVASPGLREIQAPFGS